MKTTTQERTVLITGATSGIGHELAKLFADDGSRLVLIARDEKKLEEVKTGLNMKYGVTVKTISKDLSMNNAAEDIFNELQSESITIDVLVNNAGYATFGKFFVTDLADELKMMQVNMISLVHLTKLFLPAMMEKKSGKIMNVASTAAFQPGPLMAVYYASKSFVLSFSEAIANELSGSGITVTALCPGPTETGFQKRANMEESKLVQGKIMNAATVARLGYKALIKGKRVEITGIKNKMLAETVRFSPRKFTTSIVRMMQEKES